MMAKTCRSVKTKLCTIAGSEISVKKTAAQNM